MIILHKETDGKGSFYVEQNGEILAEMTYVWAGKEKIIIDHTHVDDSLRGKRVGNLMLEQAVIFARDKGIKIIPLCPFAKSVFDKTEMYQDLI